MLMSRAPLPRLKYAVLHGTVITLADLPEGKNVRWVKRRKQIVVAAVRAGLLTATEACRRYQLSPEEFEAWNRAFGSEQVPGGR